MYHARRYFMFLIIVCVVDNHNLMFVPPARPVIYQMSLNSRGIRMWNIKYKIVAAVPECDTFHLSERWLGS